MKKILLGLVGGVMCLTAWSVTREEALGFLYGSMSLPDRVDYDTAFYEANVDASLRARAEMPWGQNVPDREFLHFVLPVRVNNENLDESRIVFYDQLKYRVKGLSMAEAILEVNHWCHEKVTYRPSDARTSSPLSTVSQAIGRCGEESTFTVAALRSVGIPARQIYTPRWAHTDDNHAWVEAWADGKWYFLGACEPEPVLNLAWFNAPASRGLLMNTNVTGRYIGPEEVLRREPLTTRINVTSNYAPVDTLSVRVLTPDGTPASGANVNFCIYNYSEFYPAVTKTADAQGHSSLVAGIGDMIVWATDGERFGLTKARPGEAVTVMLDRDDSWQGVFETDMIPPVPGNSQPAVTAAQRVRNDRRFAEEDSIRNAYSASFRSDADARELAHELSLNPDSLARVLTLSRGNHEYLESCLAGLPSSKREKALNLLLNVSEKDLRDITADVVIDNVLNSVEFSSVTLPVSEAVYNRHILSPRIENEGLRPWRASLGEALGAEKLRGDVDGLIRWIKENITLADEENPLNLRISPMSVMRTRKADRLSLGIFFVAAARTLGIPARIDPVTGAVQYIDDSSRWQTVKFAGDDSYTLTPRTTAATLSLTFTPTEHIIDPKYYSQFSISKIENGRARQLEFDEEGTVSSIFEAPVELEAGQYMIVTGQRLANGGVLARTDIFTLAPGEDMTREVMIRQDDSEVSVIGSLNAENIYHDLKLDIDKSLLSTAGRGYYILGLLSPNHEPSTHMLNDISAVASQLEGAGVKIMLLFDSTEAASRFNPDAFPKLPATVTFGIDKEGASRRDITDSLHLKNPDNPLIVIADTFNRVVWCSEGYTIGSGEQLLSILRRIE